jgi:CheY-like chemotaxis protein
MRILWIEDRPEQIKYHVSLLRNSGHDITECNSGGEALKTILASGDSAGGFELIILDIMLPIMLPKGEGALIDASTLPELMGLEIVRQMRAAGVSTPVIGVSAVADDQLRQDITVNFPFVVGILKKPVSIDVLKAVIANVRPSAATTNTV